MSQDTSSGNDNPQEVNVDKPGKNKNVNLGFISAVSTSNNKDSINPMNATPAAKSNPDGQIELSSENNIERDDNDHQSNDEMLSSATSQDRTEIYRQQLIDVQQDIKVLSQALAEKVKKESELKSLLGIGLVDDIKRDINQTVDDIKRNEVFQRTAQGIRSAANKVQPQLYSINATVKKQVYALKSVPFFKSFEENMSNTWKTMKERIAGTPSTNGVSNVKLGSQRSNSIDNEHVTFKYQPKNDNTDASRIR